MTIKEAKENVLEALTVLLAKEAKEMEEGGKRVRWDQMKFSEKWGGV